MTPAEPVAAILRGAPASVTIMRGPRRPLLAGASARLLAEVRDLGGQTVPGSRVSWSSTDSAVARVDSASGRVRAVRPGRALVMASSGALRDSLAIVVRPPTALLRPPSLPPHPIRSGLAPPSRWMPPRCPRPTRPPIHLPFRAMSQSLWPRGRRNGSQTWPHPSREPRRGAAAARCHHFDRSAAML